MIRLQKAKTSTEDTESTEATAENLRELRVLRGSNEVFAVAPVDKSVNPKNPVLL